VCRLREHIEDPNNLPILVFPEGTVNSDISVRQSCLEPVDCHCHSCRMWTVSGQWCGSWECTVWDVLMNIIHFTLVNTLVIWTGHWLESSSGSSASQWVSLVNRDVIFRLRRPSPSSPRPWTASCHVNIALQKLSGHPVPSFSLLRLHVDHSASVMDDWLWNTDTNIRLSLLDCYITVFLNSRCYIKRCVCIADRNPIDWLLWAYNELTPLIS